MNVAHLIGIATRLVRQETYEGLIAPAIADLPFESGDGRWSRARGYIAVWRAILFALTGEIADDCSATVRSAHISSAIGPALMSVAFTGVIFAPMMWMTYGHSPAPWHHDLVLVALWLPGLLAVLAPTIAVPAAAVLARSNLPGSHRAALLLTAATVVTICAANSALHDELTEFRWDMLYTSSTSVRAGTPGPSALGVATALRGRPGSPHGTGTRISSAHRGAPARDAAAVTLGPA
jgi:uncharacterized protein (DUF983 family)